MNLSSTRSKAAFDLWTLLPLFFILVSVYLYLPAIHYPFIWDDEAQVVNNELIRHASNLPRLLLGPTFDVGGGVLAGAYWRPLVVISNFINYQIWGENPAGFRLYQLGLHCAVILLLFILIKQLAELFQVAQSKELALLVTSLYAVQPVHVESVIYIGSIGEVLYTLFSIAALIFFTKSLLISDQKKQLNFEIVFFILTGIALLAKESAVVVFLIAAFLGYVAHRKGSRFWLRYITGASATVGVYAFLRLFIAHVVFIKDYGSYISSASLYERLLTVPYVILSYIVKLTVPVRLVIYENKVVHSPLDPAFWLYGTGVLALAVLIAVIAMKVRSRLFIFFIAWFVISLLPILNIYAIDMTVADRWMYFPAIGFFGAAAVALMHFLKRNIYSKVFALLFIVALMGYAGRTIVREYEWRSAYSLYGHDVRYVQDSFELLNNYGLELMRLGRLQEARGYFERAVKLRPQWFISQTNLGAIYQELGLNDQAEQQYLRVRYCDGNPFASANLITLYINKGEYGLAQQALTEARRFFPTFKRLDFLDVWLKYKTGKNTEALNELSDLLKSGVVDRDIEEFIRQAQKYNEQNTP